MRACPCDVGGRKPAYVKGCACARKHRKTCELERAMCYCSSLSITSRHCCCCCYQCLCRAASQGQEDSEQDAFHGTIGAALQLLECGAGAMAFAALVYCCADEHQVDPPGGDLPLGVDDPDSAGGKRLFARYGVRQLSLGMLARLLSHLQDTVKCKLGFISGERLQLILSNQFCQRSLR